MKVQEGTLVAVLDVEKHYKVSGTPGLELQDYQVEYQDLLGMVTGPGTVSELVRVRISDGSEQEHLREKVVPLVQVEKGDEEESNLEELLRKYLPQVILSLARQGTAATRALVS